MNFFNNIRIVLAVALAIGLAVPPGLQARSKDKLLKLAQAAEARKDYDQALDFYKEALAKDPYNAAYELGMHRCRFEAGQIHVERGLKLRQTGKLEEALAEFQKAFTIDPSSSIALQEMRITMKMMEDAKNGPPKPESERGLTPAEQTRTATEKKLQSIEGVPELKPIQRQIATLKMNNQPPKVLYETVGKLAGINVIFDPQFQPNVRNANLDLSNTNLEDALNYVALVTHTFWKAITSNAIFVTDDNPTKRRDFENVAVKTFYLQNPTTPQEFQEIVTAVRTVSDCRRMFTANALNAIVARCTVDQLGLVEKLIHDLDKPKSEVVVDLLVLSASTSHTRDLAMGLTNGSGVTGLNLPIGFTPRNPVVVNGGGGGTGSTTQLYTYDPTSKTYQPFTGTTGTGTGTAAASGQAIAVGGVRHISINDYSISLPGFLLQAVLSDSNTRILQSPQVRASDGMKVTLNIGQRIPYASGSYQPGIGGVGVNPLVQTNFQYADVGVNLIVQPRIHGTDEVTLHIEVDISSVVDHVDFGGLSQPVIGQQKNTTDLRVRDGEVSLLGGLLQGQDSNSGSGIPGLVNVPLLGHMFFGNSHKEKDRQELLIALIPHIVRAQSLSELDMRGIGAGTDQDVQLRYAPSAETAPVQPTGTQPALPAEPAPPVQPATEPGPGTPAAAPRATFMPGRVQVRVGGPVVPTLQVENVNDLSSAIVHVRWDPKILRLNAITPGQFLSMDGQPVTAPMDIRNDAGEATINLSRSPGAAGVSGSGALSAFSFTAIAPGSTAITVTDFGPMNSKQEAIKMTAPAVNVTVQ